GQDQGSQAQAIGGNDNRRRLGLCKADQDRGRGNSQDAQDEGQEGGFGGGRRGDGGLLLKKRGNDWGHFGPAKSGNAKGGKNHQECLTNIHALATIVMSFEISKTYCSKFIFWGDLCLTNCLHYPMPWMRWNPGLMPGRLKSITASIIKLT
ncbi:MAG TPA: hypothetical protein PKO03_09300, partial [Anaerolineaceae bacterium]|nr:hypothetical protein [Anaerolineaceae bacterium]